MIELDSTLHRFDPDHFGTLDDFLDTSDRGRRDTLMIACADHGTAPDHVSFAGTERFHVLQHLAQSVPCPGDRGADHLPGAIEIGFLNDDLRHAVVMGHLGCQVIPHWIRHNRGGDVGGHRARFFSTTVPAVRAAYPGLAGRALEERLICEHALFQMENLQAHPFIREQLRADTLKLHLWVVDDATARVLAFDPCRGNLVPIEAMRSAGKSDVGSGRR